MIELSNEDAERIWELLGGYEAALDNILYVNYPAGELDKLINDIQRLRATIEAGT